MRHRGAAQRGTVACQSQAPLQDLLNATGAVCSQGRQVADGLNNKTHVLQPRKPSEMCAKHWRKCAFLCSNNTKKWTHISYIVLSCFLNKDCQS